MHVPLTCPWSSKSRSRRTKYSISIQSSNANREDSWGLGDFERQRDDAQLTYFHCRDEKRKKRWLAALQKFAESFGK